MCTCFYFGWEKKCRALLQRGLRPQFFAARQFSALRALSFPFIKSSLRSVFLFFNRRKFKLDPSTESIHYSFLGYQYRPLTIKEMADFDDDDFGGVEAVACVFFWAQDLQNYELCIPKHRGNQTDSIAKINRLFFAPCLGRRIKCLLCKLEPHARILKSGRCLLFWLA